MKKQERVAIYIRVSTQEQKLKGLSPEAQRDALRRFAEKHNLKIVEWYEDLGVSGRKLIRKRPALQRMIRDAEAGKFDRIIFIKLDRFFRSVAEYHECMKRIEPVLWTATEEKYDLTTANGRAFVNMKLTIAELEADQTGERIDLVNEYKVKTGSPLTGTQPFGYKVQTNEAGHKTVVKDETVSEAIEFFIESFTLTNSKKKSMILTNERYDLDVCYNTWSGVLTKEQYTGEYRGNKNYCPAYLSSETQKALQGKTNIKANARQGRVYIFSGLIKCPLCGHSLAGNWAFSGFTQREYHSYRCNNSRKNHRCTFGKAVSEKKIEKYLLKNIEAEIEKYNIKAMATAIEPEAVDIDKQVKKVEKEMKRLNDMYRKGRIEEEDYDRDYEELELKLKELQTKVITPAKPVDTEPIKHLIEGDFEELYNQFTDEEKRFVWRSIIKEIHIDEEKNVVNIDFL